MKTEELKDLGLDDAQIKKVFELNGQDIQNAKKEYEHLEGDLEELRTQNSEYAKKLKEFDGVDVNQLHEQIQTLNEQIATNEQKWTEKIAERDFNDKLQSSITKFGGKNAKAIKALLDIENLKVSKNQDADIQAQLEQVKQENDYLFASNEPIKNPVMPTGNTAPKNNDEINKVRSVMGLPPLKD